VIDIADGRAVDLAGAVTPDLYAELEAITSHRASPALRCGTCHGGIYLQHGRAQAHRDVLFGYHHPGGEHCPVTFTVRRAAPMSDEHKRQAEYHATAAQRAGHAADLEVTTTGRTRVDVVVDGRFGFEVQRSALSKASAVQRTARSVTGGGLDVVAWFSDTPGPPWTGHVPGYRCAAVAAGWTALPLPGSVIAVGLQTFEPVRDGGKHTLRVAPWRGVRVDEVVAGLAEGRIVPVWYRGFVRLMPAEAPAVYQDLAGHPLPAYDPGQPRPRQLAPSARAECDRAPLPETPAATQRDVPRVRGVAVQTWREVNEAIVDGTIARERASGRVGQLELTLADTRFWCQTCGRMHPLREHRHCRAAAS
jgi:hypothetical protein